MGKKVSVKQRYDGEWHDVSMREYYIVCCHCALVHRVDFRVKNDTLQMRAFQDGKRTAWLRKHRPLPKLIGA